MDKIDISSGFRPKIERETKHDSRIYTTLSIFIRRSTKLAGIYKWVPLRPSVIVSGA